MIKIDKTWSERYGRYAWVGLLLAGHLFVFGCTLASPFNQFLAAAEPTPTFIPRTPQPTFTSTPVPTLTPSQTPTPTITPSPTNTRTPTVSPTPRPSATPTPTETRTPGPPTPTPGPTDTPTPSWDFQLAELYSQPTDATLLSIIVAVQSGNDWIPGYRVVGIDPNGIATQSEPSADGETGHTPPAEVIKSGNTKFEPQPVAVYITGTWTFYLESADGRQVSPAFTVNMDVENREWYFFRFTPK